MVIFDKILYVWLLLGAYSKNKRTVKQPHSADLAKVRNKHSWGTNHSITPVSYITNVSMLRM